MTEAEKKRFEEKRARKKEKQKAKREELKAAKKAQSGVKPAEGDVKAGEYMTRVTPLPSGESTGQLLMQRSPCRQCFDIRSSSCSFRACFGRHSFILVQAVESHSHKAAQKQGQETRPRPFFYRHCRRIHPPRSGEISIHIIPFTTYSQIASTR